MSRMMASSRWTQRPSQYCCPGHDPDWYLPGRQRARENQEWRASEREGLDTYREADAWDQFPYTEKAPDLHDPEISNECQEEDQSA